MHMYIIIYINIILITIYMHAAYHAYMISIYKSISIMHDAYAHVHIRTYIYAYAYACTSMLIYICIYTYACKK